MSAAASRVVSSGGSRVASGSVSPCTLVPIPQADGGARIACGAPEHYAAGMVQPDGARYYSRALNAVEGSAEVRELDQALDAAIEAVYTTFSARYLRTLQQFLRPYSTHRHTITIYAGMGVCGIDVDGVDVEDMPSRGLYRLLKEMARSLASPWCAYLDGVRLN